MKHEKNFTMFQCAAEPWWVFKASAKALAREYHVYLFIADGHDEQGTTFVSIEKTVEDAAAYLKEHRVRRLDGVYGVSMGGASVIIMRIRRHLMTDTKRATTRRKRPAMREAGGASEFVRQYTLASGAPCCDCGYKKLSRR